MNTRPPYKEYRAIGRRQTQFRSGPRWLRRRKLNIVPPHTPTRGMLRSYRRENEEHIAIAILQYGLTEQQAKMIGARLNPAQIKSLSNKLKPEHFQKIMDYGKKQAKVDRRDGEPRGHYRARLTREIDHAVLDVINSRGLLPRATMALIERAAAILARIGKDDNLAWQRRKREAAKKALQRLR